MKYICHPHCGFHATFRLLKTLIQLHCVYYIFAHTVSWVCLLSLQYINKTPVWNGSSCQFKDLTGIAKEANPQGMWIKVPFPLIYWIIYVKDGPERGPGERHACQFGFDTGECYGIDHLECHHAAHTGQTGDQTLATGLWKACPTWPTWSPFMRKLSGWVKGYQDFQ